MSKNNINLKYRYNLILSLDDKFRNIYIKVIIVMGSI